MRFLLRKRRPTPTVIIVALIDVLIVLLIFLMVTTTFRQQQSALPLALPESSQAHKTGANENSLEVSIDAKGVLRLGPEGLPVTDDRLKSELLAQAAKNPQLKLAIRADKEAPFGQFVKVFDAAKEAKIKTISAFTKEPAKP